MSCSADCATDGLRQCVPTGYISTHGAYFAPSPNINAKEEHSERAVLLLTDDQLETTRILADNLALRLDCDVWVPDYLQGTRRNVHFHANLRSADGAKIGAGAWMKSRLRSLRRTSLCIINRPSVIDARLHKFIQALQEENDYLKIGAVGYCSGCSTAIRLASTEYIQSVRQFRFLLLGYALKFVDDEFTKALGPKTEAAFRRRNSTQSSVDYEFEGYKGTIHGSEGPQHFAVTEKAFERIPLANIKTAHCQTVKPTKCRPKKV
ncbi:hypothetical protein LshimejAT787_2300070 [Lyophyllum shimeji]|uniref:Uncharacterized protein n=1 Tax=Lyophyllum shimeji TaxID=47721 RepID=A0A9P3UUS5_LYOSH|nr:hypothetical protein LshimejAT787_2300070 [Lyophyllum shimeji]